MKATWTLALVAGILSVAWAKDLSRLTCSANYVDFGYDTADVVMGVILNVREGGSGNYGCGKPATGVIQWLEAIKFTINTLNNFNGGAGYVPGVKFGMRAYDPCVSQINALRAVQELYPQSTSYKPYCADATPKQVNMGIVGPYHSSLTIPVAEYAKDIPVTLISPTAASGALSDSAKYPTFFRTGPSTTVQSKAIAALLNKLQWKKVVVFYFDESYATSGYQEIVKASKDMDICVSHAVKLPATGTVSDYKTVLENIGSNDFTAGVITGIDSTTRRLLEAIQQVPVVQKIHWITMDLDDTTAADPTRLKYMRGVMNVRPKSFLIPAFRDYYVSLQRNPANVVDNPYFKELYEILNSCSLTPGSPNQCVLKTKATLDGEFHQNPYVITTIKAVMAMVESYKSLCNQGTTGLCDEALRSSPQDIQNILKGMDFTFPAGLMDPMTGEKIKFEVNGDAGSVGWSVIQYNNQGGTYAFNNIGTIENGQVTLSSNPLFYDQARDTVLPSLTSLCGLSGCASCLMPPNRVHFTYSPGDVVIASLISAHESTGSLFSCGLANEGRLASMVAAKWAVQDYNARNPSKLAGVKLGSLVADVCPTGAVAAGFLNDLYSSSSRILDSDGLAISTRNNIYGFVDETGNMMADAISPILHQFHVPEIQVGATHTAIHPDADHPYFSRIVPNEEAFLKALTALLVMEKWRHVQVLTVKDSWYSGKADRFKAYAAKHGICVVSTAYFNDGMAAVLPKLVADPNTFVVVTFGSADNIKALFDQIKATGQNNKIEVVAGLKEWATDPHYINADATDAITIATAGLDNSNFAQYLSGLSRSAILADPLLTSLFETSNNCALTASKQGLYPRMCTAAEKLSPYKGYTTKLIAAITNMADSLHEILRDVCGPNYSGLCSDFQSLTDVPEKLAAKLRNSPGITNGEGDDSDIRYYGVVNGVYQVVGSYAAGRISNMNYMNKPTSCPGACVECQYLYMYKDMVYQPGDFLIAGSFSVSSSGPSHLQPYQCGDIKAYNGPLYTAAMMYALERVNSNKAPVSVKGISIGGLIFDHCSNHGRQSLLVSDIYSGFLHRSHDVDENKIISWITGGSGSTREAAMFLDPLGIPMVSPDATSEALLDDYDNFFRTIQGDDTTASAFVKMAKQQGYRYIQVVHSASVYGREYKQTLVNIAESEGICVTAALELDGSPQAIVQELVASKTNVVILIMGTSETDSMLSAITQDNDARNSLLIMLPEPFTSLVEKYGVSLKYPPLALQLRESVLSEFQTYLARSPVDNVFFARYYMKLYQCNLDGYNMYDNHCSDNLASVTANAAFQNSNFDLATINAVYASVDALDRTLKELCGEDYTSPCPAFYTAPDRNQRYANNLNSVSFIDDGTYSFRFLQREGNVAINVLQYSKASTQQKKVGTFADVSLNLDSSQFENVYQGVESSCNTPCLECINTGLNFTLTPGDIYLAGVFDVHEASFNPFLCGKINTLHGFLLLEAFHYALDQVNSNTGQFKDILHGVKLGGVGLDACSSQVRGGQLVSNIMSKVTPLSKGSITVDSSHIDVYLGSYHSGATRYLARILTDIGIPQISYAASSIDLSDERLYPYFYRTVPSNSKMIKAILAYLNENDIRYIQVLYFDDNYGMSGMKELTELAASYKICVAQTVMYPDAGEEDIERSKAVVAELIQTPAANTVVTFLDTGYINSVLDAVGQSVRARGKLRFVGSDIWADNKLAIQDQEQQAIDSVTLKLDADDVVDFETYINSKTLSNSAGNPWYEEYYQEIHNCYTTTENPNGYARRCPESISSIISSSRYQQDPNVLNVMNAVYASAFAIDEALKDICGDGYTAVCQAYRNQEHRGDHIRKTLDDVEFMGQEGKVFRFDDREADLNYRYNAIVSGDLGKVNYREIGTYDVADKSVHMTGDYQPRRPWRSGCDREDACTECPTIRDSTTRYAFYPSPVPSDAPLVIGFFDVHQQGVDPYRCGNLNPAGFQQMMAFFYGVSQVFGDKYLQGPSQFGTYGGIRVLAIDTCSNPIRVDQDLFGLLDGTGLCNTLFDTHGAKISAKNIGGVIVPGNQNAMAASRLLEPLDIAYISPDARSPLLDDKMHLARTVAPLRANMRFLAQLIHHMDWTYMDAVYQDNEMGYFPYTNFMEYTEMAGLCLASPFVVGEGDNDQDVEDLLANLNGDIGSKVVVLFGTPAFFKRVLAAAKRIDIVDDYTWIIVTDVEMDEAHIEAMAPDDADVEMITFYSKSYTSPGFQAYLGSSTASNRDFIPRGWWEEWFQMMNECTISHGEKPINVGKPECNMNMPVSMASFMHDPSTVNTIVATYAAAYGIDTYQDDNLKEHRMEIMEKLLEAKIANLMDKSIASERVKFEFEQEERWWEPGYLVHYWKVGDQDVKDHKTLDLAELPRLQDVASLKTELNESSMCQQTARQGYCGCDIASVDVAAFVDAPDMGHISHRNYYEYDKNGEREWIWPKWAIILGVLTSIGLLVCLVLFLILICLYPKKGGTSILGYMMVLGIIGMYAINFAFFENATDATCGIRRFLMGVVYTICFAPLLIKAVDNWRYGHTDHAERRYSGISSPCALVMCAFAVVLIQCIIPIMWLILEHPTVTVLAHNDHHHDNHWCDPSEDYDLGLVLSFSFVLFIVLMTGIFSACSYHTHTNNYESRWILFSSVATAGCLMVWMIVTTNAKPLYRDPAVAIGNFVNATILLLAVPLRKTYLMIKALNSDNKPPQDDVDGNDYDMYGDDYVNPGYELSDYDQVYMEKPSEF